MKRLVIVSALVMIAAASARDTFAQTRGRAGRQGAAAPSDEEKITPAEIRAILATAPGIKIVDDMEKNYMPMPKDASGQDDILFLARESGEGLDQWDERRVRCG